jgi:LPXTG-motif cell wall-anchored protein
MTATLLIFGLPIAFLAGMAVLFFRKRRRGIGEGLGLFAVCFAAGAWAILQSRASTAAIGFLFLPSVGAVAGALGWVSGNLRGAQALALRASGWVCLLAGLALPAWEIVGGAQTIALNQRCDTE